MHCHQINNKPKFLCISSAGTEEWSSVYLLWKLFYDWPTVTALPVGVVDVHMSSREEAGKKMGDILANEADLLTMIKEVWNMNTEHRTLLF